MNLRDHELLEAIRRDDLAYVLTCRYEKPFDQLLPDDVPFILMHLSTPLMASALFGSVKCFNFFVKNSNVDYVDDRKRHVIHFAAAGGNLQIFNYFKDPDFYEIEDENKNTALHYAAKFGQVTIVQNICSKASTINCKNRDGFAASHFAAMCGSLPIIQMLHNAGDDLKSRNCLGWTPLHYAMKYKYRNIIDYLMRNQAICIGDCDEFASILNLAASINEPTIIQTIIEAEYDISQVDHNGWTLIDFISANGHEALMELVIPYIKDSIVAHRDIYQRTVIHHLAINGQLNMIIMLEKLKFNLYDLVDKFGKTALHYAAEFGHFRTFRYLLGKIPINSVDKMGMTPLHLAAYNNQIEIVEFLCSISDCDLNIRDIKKKTPLYIACERSNNTIVQLLISHGADFRAITPNNISLISVSVIQKNPDLCQYLCNVKDIDIFFMNKNSWSPAHYAAQLGDVILLEFFHDILAESIFQPNRDGRTPLHIAAMWNQLKIIQFFNELNADFNVMDNDGNTPLHLATKRGNVQIAQYLKDNTLSDLNIQNKLGQTPLHIAIEIWNLDLISDFVSTDSCDLNIKDKKGMTPFLLSTKLGQVRIVQYLTQQSDIVVDSVDNKGFSAPQFAAMLRTRATLQTLYETGKFDLDMPNSTCRPIDIAKQSENHEIISYLNALYHYDPIEEEEEDENDSEYREKPVLMNRSNDLIFEEEEEEGSRQSSPVLINRKRDLISKSDGDDDYQDDDSFLGKMPKTGTIYDSSVNDEGSSTDKPDPNDTIDEFQKIEAEALQEEELDRPIDEMLQDEEEDFPNETEEEEENNGNNELNEANNEQNISKVDTLDEFQMLENQVQEEEEELPGSTNENNALPKPNNAPAEQSDILEEQTTEDQSNVDK